jgi:hypothetical protein
MRIRSIAALVLVPALKEANARTPSLHENFLK